MGFEGQPRQKKITFEGGLPEKKLKEKGGGGGVRQNSEIKILNEIFTN